MLGFGFRVAALLESPSVNVILSSASADLARQLFNFAGILPWCSLVEGACDGVALLCGMARKRLFIGSTRLLLELGSKSWPS